MKVIWKLEVHGRQPGQVEDLDPETEPRLKRWLQGGKCVAADDTPKSKAKGKGSEDKNGGTS